MAADWPVSAQEAAARLFAQALPVPQRHNAAPSQQSKHNQHTVNTQNFWNQPNSVQVQKPQTKPCLTSQSSLDSTSKDQFIQYPPTFWTNMQEPIYDPKDQNTWSNTQDIQPIWTQPNPNNNNSWNSWIPCLNENSCNVNDTEPILIGPPTPTDEVRCFISQLYRSSTQKHFR